MAEAHFDHIADNYDQDFSNTLIGSAQRKLVWNILERYYPKLDSLSVLEVNCGTGVDAERMANQGANIMATDISVEMVKQTSKRLEKYTNASVQALDVNNISEIDQSFDLIFSNFGGLNCLNERELNLFVLNCSKKLKPGGRLIMVIMPKHTLWEMLYYSAKFAPKQSFRRWTKKGIDANVDGKAVKTFYYNPSQFYRDENFHIESITPVGFFVPPSYLEHRYRNKGHRIQKLYERDKKTFNKQRLAQFADHFCIVMKKK